MKFLKIFITLAIMLGSVNCVYAEDGGVSDALRTVKERIDTSAYEKFESSYHKEEDGTTEYYFNWSNEGNSSTELYVTVCNGIITNYGKYDYSYNYDEEAAKPFSLDKDEAVKIAKEFVDRINPSICQNIAVVPDRDQSIYSDEYDFDIYRSEGGIPVLYDTGYMSLSRKTKEVTHFYINYKTGISFKSLNNVISEDAAKKAYKEFIQPTLRYRYKRDYENRQVTAYLEYVPKEEYFAINAYDGNLYEMTYDDEIYYSKNMESEDAASGESGFSPAEIEETERIAGLLSEDEAIAIVRKNDIIAMPKNIGMEYISLNKSWYSENEYFYNISFQDDKNYIDTRLDAKTGEILSFYNYSADSYSGKQNRTKEMQKAEKAFKAFAGDKAAEFKLEEDDYVGYISYIRTFDGLDVYDDGAYFSFDGKDNIDGYNLRYTNNVEFPSKNDAMSPDEALDKAFEKCGFQLVYYVDNDNKTAQPIYCMGVNGETDSFNINAISGAFLTYWGDEITPSEKMEYTDIDNHYGKQIFNTLAEYGIGFEGGELKPNNEITQAEYFSLLNSAFGYETDIDDIYDRMTIGGTISKDERADESPVTREKAAVYMAREMGAEEYAKYEDIYTSPFEDVLQYKGYISILKAKGVINGDGSGYFHPENTVTRGEALIMLYNYFLK